MSELVQQLANALALGSIYALVALGLALVFSVLGLVNFAQGMLITLAGYGMWAVTGAGGPWIVLMIAAVAAGAAGALVLERLVFAHLRNASLAAMLLASLGVAAILQTGCQIVFGTAPKSIGYPDWTRETVDILGARVQLLNLVTVATTLLLLVALVVFLRRTVVGLALRASAEDFAITRLMGVRAGLVVGSAFVVSGALAGIAAFFWFGSSGLVQPDGGTTPLLKGFIAVVIGGLGSLQGAIVAGFVLGALEVMLQSNLPESVTSYTDTFVFVALILVVLVRPEGLIRREARTA